MQFRRGCWSRLQGHWTQDRPSFFLNLPTVNVPTDSTGRFSNEFNLTQQLTNLPITNKFSRTPPTSTNPLSIFIYKLIHLKLITFDILHFFVDLFEQFIHQKIQNEIVQYSIRVSKKFSIRKIVSILTVHKSTLLFNHFSSPLPSGRIRKEKISRCSAPAAAAAPKTSYNHKSYRRGEAEEGARGWLVKGEYVPPSHRLPNK